MSSCRTRQATLSIGLLASLLTFAAPRIVGAQIAASAAGEPDVPEKAGKEFRAFRIRAQAPRIDGHFDDEVWTLAQPIDDMVQNEPNNMAAPADRTVVQVAYDDRALYVAVRCFMHDPSQLTTGLGRRDSLPPSDLIRMSFDPRHDHQNAYVFETNPSGMQSDYLFYDDTRQSPDYDAVWDVRTSVDSQGWSAEYYIPFSQMRFIVPDGERVVWGFNIRRDTYKTAEYDRWVPTPRGAAGFVSRFGHLIFDDRLAPPRRVELLPFTLARSEHAAGDPSDESVAGGMDLRVGLGTAATLSATVNPDFGQVEQDPAVLNLSVFETFYPEKRPFFLEDSRIFVPAFPQMLLFHSRRIGRAPGRIAVPSGDTVIEQPDATTIYGAAKVTGKSNGWTFGGLTALTAPEYAEVETSSDAGISEDAAISVVGGKRLIEPRTLYSVGRVQHDFQRGQSNVGALVTSVMRAGDRDAVTGGMDYTLRWDTNRGSWTGIVAGTHAPVGQTIRNGMGMLSNFNYGRKHYSVNGHFDHFSPYFRNTDIGFLSTRVNKTNVNYGVNLIQPDPGKRFRSYTVYAFGSQSWNNERLVFDNSMGTGVDITLLNFSGGFIEFGRDFDRMDDLDTRGGPPIVKPGSMRVSLGARTDSRKTWQISVNANAVRGDQGGWSSSIGPFLRMQPSPRVQTTISANYQPGLDIAQWITNTDVTGDSIKDNIYGRLSRHVVSITGRTTYAFSRDMTLEAYLQPFVAVGAYTDIRRLAAPRSFEFEPASITTNPDFNTKSLRANVVFRWEYQKGSTLFLVWNRSAVDGARPGVFSPWRDLGNAFTGPGTNVFMIKANYWLPL
ncbi:MAG TPA: DUF5916 domain-containing protein [Vicinamibacterales bacterium]|jgi:hypothetical protein|nr:DUF5916 domain-containing protein [Vicinamibacterales bacterium]